MNSARGQIAEAHAAVADARREFDGVKTALARIRDAGMANTDQRFTDLQKDWGRAATAYSDALSHYAAVINAHFPECKPRK